MQAWSEEPMGCGHKSHSKCWLGLQRGPVGLALDSRPMLQDGRSSRFSPSSTTCWQRTEPLASPRLHGPAGCPRARRLCKRQPSPVTASGGMISSLLELASSSKITTKSPVVAACCWIYPLWLVDELQIALVAVASGPSQQGVSAGPWVGGRRPRTGSLCRVLQCSGAARGWSPWSPILSCA